MRWAMGLAVGLGIVGLATLWTGEKKPPPTPHIEEDRAVPLPRSDRVGRRGPWGQLEVSEIVIAPPLRFLDPEMCPTRATVWQFPDFDRPQLEALLEGLGLTPAHRAEALALSDCKKAPTRLCMIQESRSLVQTLSLDERTRLYRELSKYPQNPDQFYAFAWPAEQSQAWLESIGLPSAEQKSVGALFYRAKDMAFLADTALACTFLAPADRSKLLKAMGRTRALVVQLHVEEREDVHGLAEYWKVATRRKAPEMLLESLASRPGGGTIDVTHFLPPGVRELLYTFPDPREGSTNCHWTSLNFFEETPDNRYLDWDTALQAFRDRYEPIEPPYQLGDLVLLESAPGVAAHSMVWIADEVVFTKNGLDPRRPWHLAWMQDVIRDYRARLPLEVRVVRKRTRPTH